MIPWTSLAQQFQDDAFPALSGARIVRIATLVARARSVAKIWGHIYRPPDVHCCHILALLFPLVACSASFAMLGAQI